MRRDGRGLDGWDDDLGADDAALPQSRGFKTGRRNPSSGRRADSSHKSVYVMTLARTTAGINKAEDAETAHGQINPPMRCSELSDDGVRLSPIAGLDPPRDLVRPKFSNI